MRIFAFKLLKESYYEETISFNKRHTVTLPL